MYFYPIGTYPKDKENCHLQTQFCNVGCCFLKLFQVYLFVRQSEQLCNIPIISFLVLLRTKLLSVEDLKKKGIKEIKLAMC